MVEGRDGLADVGADSAGKSGKGGGPGGWCVVVGRVGPIVGEMEVEIDMVVLLTEALGQGKDVREVILAGDRVDP